MDNYYRILGIAEDATQREINASYRRLALRTHPDKGGDPAKFRVVNEAYVTLSDPEARKTYDKSKKKRSLKQEEEFEVFVRVFGAAFDVLVEQVWRKQKLEKSEQTYYWSIIGAASGALFGSVLTGGIGPALFFALGGVAGTS